MQPKKERKDVIKSRLRILETAQSLFAEHGINNITMRKIATTAGIGQGTLYRHYAHKGEICQDLIQESSQEFVDKVSSYLQQNKEMSLQGKLVALIHYAVEFIDKHSNWLVYIQGPSCEEGQQIIYKSQVYTFLYAQVYELIAASPSMQNNKDGDAGFRTDALLATLTPDLYLFFKAQRGLTHEKIKQHIVNLYINPLFQQ